MTDLFESLVDAIIDDDANSVRQLLRKDAGLVRRTIEKDRFEPRIYHWLYAKDTALHAAATGQREEIVSQLIEAGADVCAAGNRRASQPLHYAADGAIDEPGWNSVRQAAVIRLLLKAGADVNAQDKNGATPLHRAVRTRCADAVKVLLNAGADPVCKNKPGSTAFHLAVQNTGRGGSGSEKARTAQREIIATFLQQGINPAIRDANGKTVLDWAKSDSVQKLVSSNRAGRG